MLLRDRVPSRAFDDLEVEALIREARRLRRRRWTMAICVMGAVAIGAWAAAGGFGGRTPSRGVGREPAPSDSLSGQHDTTLLKLPTGFSFTSLSVVHGELQVLGTVLPFSPNSMASRCAEATVDPQTLRVDAVTTWSCPLQVYDSIQWPGGGNIGIADDQGIRVARRTSLTGPAVIGTELFASDHWTWAHSGTPIAAGGSIYVYDAGTGLLRLSASTGSVEARISLPANLLSPIFAANANGLWIATSAFDGGSIPASLYFVGSSSDTAVLVRQDGQGYFNWIVASGNELWANVVNPQKSDPDTTYMLAGDDASVVRAVAEPLSAEVYADSPGAVGNASSGVWTIRSFESCTKPSQVLRVDPESGTAVVMAHLLPGTTHGVLCSSTIGLDPGQAITIGNDFFVLDDSDLGARAGGYLDLYRVTG
jgi:hypothetical protein